MWTRGGLSIKRGNKIHHITSEISETATIGEGVQVWQYSHIREDAILGAGTIIGRGVYIDAGVEIGNNCKVQNYSLIYAPAAVKDGVFIGPHVVLTNDHNPRAVTADGRRKSNLDWNQAKISIGEGASIGAGAVCIAPLKIGKWALIGAGSVVNRDVPDFALVVGNPAKQIGWVGHAGYRLVETEPGIFKCSRTSDEYILTSDNELRRIIDES
ncbi:WbbJ Acetyltransferase (isoleucine patch superfamily) [Candidatus Nanopelagicaceae bacterium]